MRRSDLVVVAILLPCLAATALPTLSAAHREDRAGRCATHLATLWQAQHAYMIQFGGSSKTMPSETGDAFWLKLTKTEPPLVPPKDHRLLQCPVEDVDDDGCDFRGPAFDVNMMGDGDIVGADVDGNHGVGRGGTILRKSGDVGRVLESDRLWESAAAATKGGNDAIRQKATTAKQRRVLVDLGNLMQDLLLYREFTGTIPSALVDLVEPKDDGPWPKGGFVAGGVLPKDPWGRDYVYDFDRGEPALSCLGADGKPGGSGEDADLSLADIPIGRLSNDEMAIRALRRICAAEKLFHRNDLDGNGVKDYWTGDVRGLQWLNPSPCKAASRERAIQLLDAAIAAADASPLKRDDIVAVAGSAAPYRGYLFVAFPEALDGKPMDRNAKHFAFAAMPAGKTAGWTYVVTEDEMLFRKEMKGTRLTELPDLDEWQRVR